MYLFTGKQEAVESIDSSETLEASPHENDKDVEMEEINEHCRAEGIAKFEVKNVSK